MIWVRERVEDLIPSDEKLRIQIGERLRENRVLLLEHVYQNTSDIE